MTLIKKSFTATVAVALAVCAVLFGMRPAVAEAATVDVTISNATIDPKTITGASSVKLEFDFSVPNGTKAGDTTVIALPDQFNFNGRTQTSFDITSPGGGVFAKAVVDTSEGTLTLTYTDYVESHSDNSGHITIYLQTDTAYVTKDVPFPVTLKVNNNTVVLISGEDSPVWVPAADEVVDYNFSKSSHVSSSTISDNIINYTLHVNVQNVQANNAVVTDQISSPGLTYVEGSFTIYMGTWGMTTSSSTGGKVSALLNYQDVTSQYTISISEDGRSFSIDLGDIPEGYGFRITYQVQAGYTLVNGEKIENTATYDYDGVDPVTDTETRTWATASGEAGGYNYGITINKVNKDGEPLEGATFEVTRKATGELVATVTTDANGQATVGGLLRDTYVVTETSAPEGYEVAAPVEVVAGTDEDVEIVDEATPEDEEPTPDEGDDDTEDVTPEKTETPTNGTTTTRATSTRTVSTSQALPKTGDSSSLWALAVVALGGVAAAAGILVRRRS